MENLGKTASSWDSFSETLYDVLDEFKPNNIFEYGPGVSTTIMALYPTTDTIDTVEHDQEWYERALANRMDRTEIYFEPDLDKYPLVKGRFDKYDLIFIDGRERERCLDLAHERLTENGLVILHDAERESYLKHIQKYRYIFLEDEGHTAVLTNSPVSALKYEKVIC